MSKVVEAFVCSRQMEMTISGTANSISMDDFLKKYTRDGNTQWLHALTQDFIQAKEGFTDGRYTQGWDALIVFFQMLLGITYGGGALPLNRV